jgi:hypothetical protein
MLSARNLALLDAINEIFGFARGATWDDVRRTLSSDHVREVYKVVRWLWPPDTDLIPLLPSPGAGLRALYLGAPQPEYLARGVFRFSLYSDEILLINPFMGIFRLPPNKRPEADAESYRADTLKLIYAMRMLEPWIRGNIVHLVPEPGYFDRSLDDATVSLARRRISNLVFTESEMEEAGAETETDIKRLLMRLPRPHREQMAREYDPHITAAALNDVLAYMDNVTADDPLALNQPTEERGAQIHVGRRGVNLEAALYLCHMTGAFPYTSLRATWRELDQVRPKMETDQRAWSSLSRAFGALPFHFLNDVDSKFAYDLREEDRLGGFRNFLRRVYATVETREGEAGSDRLAAEFQLELKEEYRKAEAEWKRIDTDLLRWTGTPAVLASIVGGFTPAFAAGFSLAAVLQLVVARRARGTFRSTVPMSVLLDLSRFQPTNKID